MVFIRWRAGDNMTGKDSHAEEYVQMRTFLYELGGVKISYQWTVDYIMRVMQKSTSNSIFRTFRSAKLNQIFV